MDVRSYISGYFDGEGCFTVSLSPRQKLRTGWEVRPSVSISQNHDRSEVIDIIASHFRCGSVRRDPGDHTVKWETRSLDAIVQNVLPHFESYPLLSGKQQDVERLRLICQWMLDKRHLDRHGLEQILDVLTRMNPSGQRKYSIEVVRRSIDKVKA